MPRFFADECVAALIVTELRARGFDIVSAKDLCPGASDQEVLATAANDGRVLITDDRGFGELAIREKRAGAGVIVLLLQALPAGKREMYAVDQIAIHARDCENRMSIIEPGRIRTRPLY